MQEHLSPTQDVRAACRPGGTECKGEVTISTGNRNFAGKQGQGVLSCITGRVASSAVQDILPPLCSACHTLVTDFRTGDSTTLKEVKSDATEKPSLSGEGMAH